MYSKEKRIKLQLCPKEANVHLTWERRYNKLGIKDISFLDTDISREQRGIISRILDYLALTSSKYCRASCNKKRKMTYIIFKYWRKDE